MIGRECGLLFLVDRGVPRLAGSAHETVGGMIVVPSQLLVQRAVHSVVMSFGAQASVVLAGVQPVAHRPIAAEGFKFCTCLFASGVKRRLD